MNVSLFVKFTIKQMLLDGSLSPRTVLDQPLRKNISVSKDFQVISTLIDSFSTKMMGRFYRHNKSLSKKSFNTFPSFLLLDLF